MKCACDVSVHQHLFNPIACAVQQYMYQYALNSANHSVGSAQREGSSLLLNMLPYCRHHHHCTSNTHSLRRLAGVGAWSVVSRLPSTVSGTLSPLTPCLSQMPPGALSTPTILVLQRLAGGQTTQAV